MSEETRIPISPRIPEGLKIRTQKQALDLRVQYQDYTVLALEHYADHVDNGEIDLDANLTEK